jgi:hypothetical protein
MRHSARRIISVAQLSSAATGIDLTTGDEPIYRANVQSSRQIHAYQHLHLDLTAKWAQVFSSFKETRPPGRRHHGS